MLLGWFEEGGTVREIWIKTRKIVGTAFLNYTQVFYTSRGGGSEAPIRQLARWGLLLNRHRTSLAEKIKLQYSCLFLRLLSHDLYGPSHILTILETGLKD